MARLRSNLARNRPLTQSTVSEYLGEAQNLYEDARNHMLKRKPRYNLATAFYRGLQWGETEASYYGPDADLMGERREVYNYTRAIVVSAVAEMLKSTPDPEVIAAHDDQTAMARALGATQLARSFLRNGVIPFDQLMRAWTGAMCHGGAWAKCYWDPNAGRRMRTPRMSQMMNEMGMLEQEQVLDEWGEPAFDSVAEGEICVDAVSLLDAFPNPNARSEREIRYVCHHKLVEISVLEDQYPEDFFGEPTEGRFEKTPVGAASKIVPSMNDMILYGDEVSEGTTPENELALVVELWEKPSRRAPDGRLTVFSGTSLLMAAGPLPCEWPWVFAYGPNMLEDVLIPDGIVLDLVPLQKTLNMSVTKQAEWAERILNPPLLEPRGAELELDQWMDSPGAARVQYNQGFQPKWLDTPAIPPSTFSLFDQVLRAMKDVSTQSDVSRGEVPPGASSGRALAYIAEFERGVHAPLVQLQKNSIAQIMSLCLKLARDRYAEGRLITVLGESDAWVVREFKAEDYDFDHQLIIEPYSGGPNSRALRFQETMEAFNAGIFEDTPAAKKARRMLSMDTAGRSTFDPEEQHRSRAMSENAAFMRDPLGNLEVLDQDDDEIHIDTHNLLRISAQFIALPPQVRGYLDFHVQGHEQKRMEALQIVAAEQSLLASGRPGGGPPPPAQPGLESPYDGGHSAGEGAEPTMENSAQQPGQGLPGLAQDMATAREASGG